MRLYCIDLMLFGLKIYLNLNLGLLLVDVDDFQLATICTLPSLNLLQELHLILLDDVPGDVPQLGVLSDLERNFTTE